MQQEEAGDFRVLYEQVRDYEGPRLYAEILQPFLPVARRALEGLQKYRARNTPQRPYEVRPEELWEWYALSRVHELLLLARQAKLDLPWAVPDPSPGWQGPPVRLEEHTAFLAALGFERQRRQAFHPFHHEVVRVTEDNSLGREVRVEEIYWPCFMFGQMLFSRAGAHVRCSREVMVPEVAQHSTLYFSYRRWWRRCDDLSAGWGSNSQWRTDFRRDYFDGQTYYYHLDGKAPLGPGYRAALARLGRPDLARELEPAERRELLMNRCFVRCEKPDRDQWPYYDSCVEPATEA